MSQLKPTERSEVPPKFRLLLVDDHPVVLDGYRLMLNSRPDLEVCFAAANEADALAAVAREHPDLIVTDLKMPGRGGLLFGEGKTAKEIADQLNLSPKTVAVHRDHIKEKMDFATSAEMIRQAVRWVETQRLEEK